MKKITLLFAVCLALANVKAQQPNPAHAWFEEARFGMFVHFGAFSTLCDGEWAMNNQSMKVPDYHKLQHIFNPQLFDAAAWVATAKSAGMKYITFTSRHHDSFSNWDTAQSDWNIMNTPYGKDIVRQLADECRKQGIKLGLYYSLADWSRDDYAWKTAKTGKGSGRTVEGDWNDYIAFMKAQLTELLTNYGDIAIIWFDGEWDQMPPESKESSHEQSFVDWHFDEIYGLIHTLQPDCMIANNHHLAALPGEDFQAFEKDLPGHSTTGFNPNQTVEKSMPLETCETMNSSWGYNIKDNKFKTTPELIHLLVRASGYGANLLLNVGPRPTGEIEEICVKQLAEMGEWTAKYGETIYGTTAGPVAPEAWGATTQKGKTVYIHILSPDGATLAVNLPEVKSAAWMNAQGEMKWKRDRKTGTVTFDLPATPDPVDTIIKVTLK